MQTKEILHKGTIVRYAHGETALGMITSISPNHGGSVAYYHLVHCLGGSNSAYHHDVELATDQEVADFWAYRKKWNCQEIMIDDVPQSPQGYAAWLEQRRLDTERQRKQDEMIAYGEAFQTLQRMAGYVENGSDMTVQFFQDDATKDWVVKVANNSAAMLGTKYRATGSTLKEAVRRFKAQFPDYFED